MPLTATGVEELAVLPFPSRPSSPRPQHCSAPSRRVAHMWKMPASMATEVVLPPAEDGAIAGECAGVKAAGTDGGGGDSSDRHRSEGSLPSDGRTELAGVVAPPALERAVGKARAGMEAAT